MGITENEITSSTNDITEMLMITPILNAIGFWGRKYICEKKNSTQHSSILKRIFNMNHGLARVGHALAMLSCPKMDSDGSKFIEGNE